MKQILISLCVLLLGICACTAKKSDTSSTNGTITNATVKLNGKFTTINANNAIDVYYAYASTSTAKIVCPQKERDNVKLNIKNGTLNITYNPKNKGRSFNNSIKVYVYSPGVNKFIGSSAVAFHLNCDYKDTKLTVQLNGASEIKFKNIDCNDLYIALQGASEFNTTGKIYAKNIKSSLSGASEVSLKTTIGNKIEIECSGASEFKCQKISVVNISATSSGASEIKLAGQATTVNFNASGASTINAKNLEALNGKACATGMSEIKCNVINNCETMSSGGSSVKNLQNK